MIKVAVALPHKREARIDPPFVMDIDPAFWATSIHIMLTHSDNSAIVERCIVEGADSYMMRPPLQREIAALWGFVARLKPAPSPLFWQPPGGPPCFLIAAHALRRLPRALPARATAQWRCWLPPRAPLTEVHPAR